MLALLLLFSSLSCCSFSPEDDDDDDDDDDDVLLPELDVSSSSSPRPPPSPSSSSLDGLLSTIWSLPLLIGCVSDEEKLFNVIGVDVDGRSRFEDSSGGAASTCASSSLPSSPS